MVRSVSDLSDKTHHYWIMYHTGISTGITMKATSNARYCKNLKITSFTVSTA